MPPLEFGAGATAVPARAPVLATEAIGKVDGVEEVEEVELEVELEEAVLVGLAEFAERDREGRGEREGSVFEIEKK